MENCIPLYFDCHAEVGSYNAEHPKGRKIPPVELRKHRDAWFAQVNSLNEERGGEPKENVIQAVNGKGNIVAGRDLMVTQKIYCFDKTDSK